MEATIMGKRYSLSPLQAVEVAASSAGFFDLDVDTDHKGCGQVKITAYSRFKASVSAEGKDMVSAVNKLIQRFNNG
jgi:hypothetical protein